MSDPTWKKVERRIAVYLGTTRNPGSGASHTGTRSDSKHPTLFIEVKHGGVAEIGWIAAERLFATVKERAIAERKTPVLVLHRKNASGGVANYPAYVEVVGGLVQVPLRRVLEWAQDRVGPALSRQTAPAARPGSPSDTSGSTPPPP